MSLGKTVSFPEIPICEDAEQANYRNYVAWQAQHEARRRESVTQFNLFQCRSRQRMSSQALYKEEAEQQAEAVKDIVERQLSRACECSDCQRQLRERSNSMSSSTTVPSSPTSSTSSMSSPPSSARIFTVGSTPVAKGRNTLIVSPPPRSRHHKRRAESMK